MMVLARERRLERGGLLDRSYIFLLSTALPAVLCHISPQLTVTVGRMRFFSILQRCLFLSGEVVMLSVTEKNILRTHIAHS